LQWRQLELPWPIGIGEKEWDIGCLIEALTKDNKGSFFPIDLDFQEYLVVLIDVVCEAVVLWDARKTAQDLKNSSFRLSLSLTRFLN
jgi:hypothetical protein